MAQNYIRFHLSQLRAIVYRVDTRSVMADGHGNNERRRSKIKTKCDPNPGLVRVFRNSRAAVKRALAGGKGIHFLCRSASDLAVTLRFDTAYKSDHGPSLTN